MNHLGTIATVRHQDDGRVLLKVVEEFNNSTKRFYEYLPIWDMNLIDLPKKRFSLNDNQQKIYARILESREGKYILNKLKNKKTDSIIDDYAKILQSELPPIDEHNKAKKKYRSAFNQFLAELIDVPIEGNNLFAYSSIGLTKKEIWDAFENAGLTK